VSNQKSGQCRRYVGATSKDLRSKSVYSRYIYVGECMERIAISSKLTILWGLMLASFCVSCAQRQEDPAATFLRLQEQEDAPFVATAEKCDAAAENNLKRQNEILTATQAGHDAEAERMSKDLEREAAHHGLPTPQQCNVAFRYLKASIASQPARTAALNQIVTEEDNPTPPTLNNDPWPALHPLVPEPDSPETQLTVPTATENEPFVMFGGNDSPSPAPGSPVESMPGWVYTRSGIGVPLNSVPHIGPDEEGNGIPLP
jgi:hypothetical protein